MLPAAGPAPLVLPPPFSSAWQAMCFGNSGEHGTHCALCQSSDKSDKSDWSDILCPQYRHCTMRSASQKECALLFFERHAHGARGKTLLFPPCTPFSPVCCRKACGTLCGFFTIRGARLLTAPGGEKAA